MSRDLRRVSRALLSVSDKTGLIDFARALASAAWSWSPPAAPRKAIAEAGLPVRDVSDVTGFPEMMDGRVKTLHPKVHGGLLALRDNPEHEAAMVAHGIGADRPAGREPLPVRGDRRQGRRATTTASRTSTSAGRR